MLNQILGKVFGTKHERDLKRMQPQIDAIKVTADTIVITAGGHGTVYRIGNAADVRP